MTPDATRHNPDPQYLRQLLQASGLDQVQAAARLGITDRTLRYYLSEVGSAGYRPAPYLVQFGLECAAAAAALPMALPPEVQGPAVPVDLSAWRELDEADIEAQAPAGLSWAAAWEAVDQAVRERFAQLPPHLQGYHCADGLRWPLEAIDPTRFALAMAAQAALQEGLRAKLEDVWQWLRADADRPGPTLHRLLAAERNRGRLQAWSDLGLLTDEEYRPLRWRAEELTLRLCDVIADQARAGDLAVVPWAYGPEQHSPVPRPRDRDDRAVRERLAQAEAEWQAQQLEARADTWRRNAEALRHANGGAGHTAAALRTVLHHLQRDARD